MRGRRIQDSRRRMVIPEKTVVHGKMAKMADEA
jgi:hypothetical protein